tara:strand:- start:1796 stop:2641 length:846 start_codon:yes stop_codon:yes gene_type:complete
MNLSRQVFVSVGLWLMTVISAAASSDLATARAIFASGDFPRAAEEARSTNTAEGLALAARAGLVHANLVAAPQDRLKFIEQAEEDAGAAIAAEPDFAEGHLQLAVALGIKARLEGRLMAYTEGYADEGRAHLEYVAVREPDNPWMQALLGAWHLEISEVGGFLGRTIYGADIDAGIAAYDRALALRPDDLVIVYQGALQLAALGDEPFRSRAMSLLQEARLPKNPDALETLIFERMRILKDALASGNDAMIDRVIQIQKGGAVADSASTCHQIRPPIGSPR